jgi:hypothetical protein
MESAPPNRANPEAGAAAVQSQPEPADTFLSDQNAPMLYDPDKPPLTELKEINHKLMRAFHRLVGIIADGNEPPDDCLEDIKFLFLNARHLLQRLRRLQEFENRRLVLEEESQQLASFKAEFTAILNDVMHIRPI